MKCKECNTELKNGAVTCPNCGTTEDNKTPKQISLRCKHCGGGLMTDNDKPILVCPYCGHQSLSVENDEVKIARIKTEAKKEIAFEKIKSNERIHQLNVEREQKKEEISQSNKFRKSIFAIFLIIASFLSGLFSLLYFIVGCYLAGVISVIQMLCFSSAWGLGIFITKGKKRFLHVLVALVGFILILPAMGSCTASLMTEDIEKVDWNIFVMGDKIPQPDSNRIKIHENTENELWIEVHNIKQEEYYHYVVSCKEFGYNVETRDRDTYYSAYNEVGYYLDLGYYDKELDIHLKAPTKAETIFWQEHHVFSILPKPQSTSGTFITENEETNQIIVSNVSKDDFEAYYTSCKEAGFIIDASTTEESYESYDENGNKIRLSYNSGNKEMTILFNYPMIFDDITWPIVGIGTLAPIPQRLSGNISLNMDHNYSVYIENVTKKEYEAYVQECILAGFDKNISNSENHFWADYSDEINIHVSYEGFNIMYINVSGSINGDYSSFTREIIGETKEDTSEHAHDSEENIETEAEENEQTENNEDTTTTNAPSSKYERAYVRKFTEYSIYYMFDEDTKEVVYFSTNDTGYMSGSYTGDFSTGVTISWDEWDEIFIHSNGTKAILKDGNGFEWEFVECDVLIGQKVLDSM